MKQSINYTRGEDALPDVQACTGGLGRPILSKCCVCLCLYSFY